MVLAARLRALDYSEGTVSRIMGVADHGIRDYRVWPAHVRRCRAQAEANPCALLAAFFLAEEQVPEETLRSVLGSEAVEVMRDLQWTDRLGDKVYFRFYLYPLLGCFILTDGPISNSAADHVYQLGGDSHSLARLAPRPQVASSLDHCTGSGVQAIMAAAHSQRTVGVDINPRALQMAAFNARWNEREVEFLLSDCYQGLDAGGLGPREGADLFDLITANPPFVPTPDPLSLCRGGGLSGEEVTEAIYRGLEERLAPKGLFSMVTNIPVLRDESFFERSDRWLGSRETWSSVILTSHVWTPVMYALSHGNFQPEVYGAQFDAWLEAYEAIGLREVTGSHVHAFRSLYPWRFERSYEYPTESMSPFIESWLRMLQSYTPGDGATYRPHPQLESPRVMEGEPRVYLSWNPVYRWWQAQGIWLEARAARAFLAIAATGKADSEDEEGLRELLTHNLVQKIEGDLTVPNE